MLPPGQTIFRMSYSHTTLCRYPLGFFRSLFLDEDPIIFLCSWSMATGLCIYDWADGNAANPDFSVSLLRVIFNSPSVLQGIADSMVYGMTPSVRQKWGELRNQVITTRSCFPICALESWAHTAETRAHNNDLKGSVGLQRSEENSSQVERDFDIGRSSSAYTPEETRRQNSDSEFV